MSSYSVSLIHDNRTLVQLILDTLPVKSDAFTVDGEEFVATKMRWRIITQPKLKVEVDLLLIPVKMT